MYLKTAGRAVVQLVALTFSATLAAAQSPLICSWPLETTGSGITNIAYPDTNATYWTMPVNTARWKGVQIKGTYPHARFMSFVVYDATGSVVQINGKEQNLNDVNINPDAGNSNPFRQDVVAGQPQNYTIDFAASPLLGPTNFLQFGDSRLAWIIYRIYVPNKEHLGPNKIVVDRQAGVPLPTVSLIDQGGAAHPLPACPSPKDSGLISQLMRVLTAEGIEFDVSSFLQQLVDTAASGADSATCRQTTTLPAWVPKNTGGYFPNPANKYIAIPGVCFEPNRIVVVRGKGAIFPDTFNGNPIWVPASVPSSGPSPTVQLRHWSICNNHQGFPYPAVACEADHSTNLDSSGYYTYVVAEGIGGGKRLPPRWLPPDATWLPWARDVNILAFRNMLPDPAFPYSVQAVIAKAATDPNCLVPNERGMKPTPDQIQDGADCAKNVLQEYYPEAVYCDRDLFITGGWQACFAAAGLLPLPNAEKIDRGWVVAHDDNRLRFLQLRAW
jgi:hypothetical protein